MTRIGIRVQHRWARTRLSPYLDGELNPRRRRRLERHVSACAECGPTLRSLIRVIHALRTLPRQPAPDVAERVIARLQTDHVEHDRSTRA